MACSALMKSILFPTLVALVLQIGPTQAESRASQPLRPSQKSEVMQLAKDLLLQSVRFEADGSAASHYLRRGIKTRVEWRNLVFRQLILGSLSPSELELGYKRRIYAQLGSDAYRLIDADGVSAWRSGPCPGFPGFVMIEEIHGEFFVSAPELDDFEIDPKNIPAQPDRPEAGDGRAVAKNL